MFCLGYEAGKAGADPVPPSSADDLGRLAWFPGYRAALAEESEPAADDWLAQG